MTTPIATAFVLIRPTAAGLGPALRKDLEAQSGVAGAAGAKAGKSWAAGFQKSEVTKIANRISAGLVAAGAASVYMAVKFESAMEKIHTQAGVSQKQIGVLGDGVLKLAGQVGFSPDSLATSLYHVESSFQSLGITGPKALALVRIAAEGAAVGGANLEDVTNALTAVIASGIKGAKGFAGAMGVLNATVGVGDMKMQDLAEAFGTGVLAAVKGFGVSIRDAGAALAVFGDNNIRGADAGTALRMSVMALASPIKAGTALLGSIGIKSGQLAKDMQKGGLKLALEDLVGHMRRAGISASQQGEIITKAFGKKAGVGLSVLVGQMGRFESKFPDLAKAAGGFGSAWARTQQTAAQQARELGHGLEAIGVTLGQRLLPPLMSVFGFVRTHTTLVLTLAGVVGGLALAISAASVAIRVATAAQEAWDVAMEANPIGLVIVAVAALVAGIVLLWKHSTGFRVAILGVWHAIKTAFDAVWSALKAGFAWVREHWKLLAAILFGPVGLAVDAIVTHWKAVTRAFSAVWDFLKGQWQVVFRFIVRPIGDAVAFIWRIWQAEIRDVSRVIAAIMHFFAPAVTWLVRAGRDLIGGLFAGVWDQMKLVGSWVAKVGGTILRAVTSFFGIKSPSTVFFGIGANLMKGLFRGMVHGASGLAGWVIRQIRHLGGSLLGDLGRLLGFGGGGGGAGGGGGGGGSPAGGDAARNKALARTMFPWGAAQWPPFDALEMREAGYNRFARNPSSGAYGIAQALPPTKMPFAAQAAGGSDAATQLRWMFGYIGSVYGTPAAAWAHERAFSWYGDGLKDGLFTRPTLIGVAERGPELVNITPGRGGAGRHYHVTINVPPGANKADIGRVFVEHIQAFEKGSGKGWRS